MENKRLTASELIITRNSLVALQQGKCLICERKFSKTVVACVDHDHTKGHIRGALCRACNRFEGQVNNRVAMAGGKEMPVQFVQNLARYWEVFADTHPVLGTRYHPTHKTELEKRLERNKKARERRAALKKG